MSKQNGSSPPSAIMAVTNGLEARLAILKSFLHDASSEGVDARRFINEVRLAVIQKPELQACSTDSILRCAQEVAKFRKGIGPWGAWLVPYKGTATVIWDYRAMMDMAREDEVVLDIDAGIAKHGDDFDYQKGTEEFLRHRPALDGNRGELQYAYAIATLKHGIKKFVVLDRQDVERVRLRSRAGESGPWKTDYDAMARKTAIRQLMNLLPRGKRGTVHRAMDLEDRGDHEDAHVEELAPPRLTGAEKAKQAVRAALGTGHDESATEASPTEPPTQGE